MKLHIFRILQLLSIMFDPRVKSRNSSITYTRIRCLILIYNPKYLLIVYYVPRGIMRVITRQAAMLAGDQSRDQSRDEAETKPRRDQSCEHFKRVS